MNIEELNNKVDELLIRVENLENGHSEAIKRGLENARKEGKLGKRRLNRPNNLEEYLLKIENKEISVAQAARELNVNRTTLINWIKGG